MKEPEVERSATSQLPGKQALRNSKQITMAAGNGAQRSDRIERRKIRSLHFVTFPAAIVGGFAENAAYCLLHERKNMFGDIQSVKLLYFKGFLFLLTGAVAVGLILFEHPSVRLAVLLAIAIWCFARAYYFAFYVIEHYVDPSYKFAGLIDFVKYLINQRKK